MSDAVCFVGPGFGGWSINGKTVDDDDVSSNGAASESSGFAIRNPPRALDKLKSPLMMSDQYWKDRTKVEAFAGMGGEKRDDSAG